MSFKKSDTDLAKLEAQNKRLELIGNLMEKMEHARGNIGESLEKLIGKDLAKDVSVKLIEDIEEFNRFMFELDVIMGVPGAKEAHNVLMHVTNKFERALNPQEPFKFKFDWDISEWAQWYKEALRMCMGKHAQVWDKGYFKTVMEGLNVGYEREKDRKKDL